MKQILQNMRSGLTEVVEVPAPKIRPGTVLIRTMASLVSAGTERTVVEFAEKNLVQKARSRPDLVRQVLDKAKREGILTTYESALNRLDQPLTLGYSSSGVVIEVGEGVSHYQVGDRVVCAGGGHAVHAEYALIPENLLAHLPENVSFESGAFATVTSIALNGLRLAKLQIGDSVLVIGLGLLGLLAAKLGVATGCQVAGLDINLARVEQARKLGITCAHRKDVEALVSAKTRSRGFDCVLICADTPSNDTVELAGTVARDRGSVICIGAVGLNLPRKPYYEKELFFQVSRSYGPGRYDASYEEYGQDYPIGYVRWTEGRNLEAVTDLLGNGTLNVADLISHTFPIDHGEQAYQLITGKTRKPFLGVLITYPQNSSKNSAPIINIDVNPSSAPPNGNLQLGIMGAGNFAAAVFLPIVQKSRNVAMNAIVSANGVSAAHAARKFGINHAASDTEFIINKKDIDIVAILTRHDTHADLVLKSLKAGKHVFCEKPLALTKEDLKAITQQLNKVTKGILTVGFNRRFAPMGLELRNFFSQRSEAMHLYYRINAGFISPAHWVHDAQLGGGRIIGEGCHFIDFAAYIINHPITSVTCHQLPDGGKYRGDNAVISLEFSDGSLATITYLANGDKAAPKEYVEAFCGGKTALMNDFRTLDLFSHGKHAKTKSAFKQDKGHAAFWKAFIDAVRKSAPPPIPYSEILMHSYATLAAAQSARTSQKIGLTEFIEQ